MNVVIQLPLDLIGITSGCHTSFTMYRVRLFLLQMICLIHLNVFIRSFNDGRFGLITCLILQYHDKLQGQRDSKTDTHSCNNDNEVTVGTHAHTRTNAHIHTVSCHDLGLLIGKMSLSNQFSKIHNQKISKTQLFGFIPRQEIVLKHKTETIVLMY